MTKQLGVACILSLATVLAACGTTTKSIEGYGAIASLDGLVQDTNALPTLVYTRKGAPGLGQYSRFIVDPVRVSYSDPEMRELDPDQLNEMQRRLQGAIIAELVSGGYEVGTRSGPNTMRISMTIANLKAPTAALNVARAFVPFSMSVGEVTIEAVFRNTQYNRIDAVVVNRAQGNRVFSTKPWNTWADAEASFKEWAVGIRKEVDKAHGK